MIGGYRILINYEGLCCPVCKSKLFEDDEIAVCPTCGAPHHKECYLKSGHCFYEQDHGTDQQWVNPLKNTDELSVREEDQVENENNEIADHQQTFNEVQDNLEFIDIKIDKNEEIEGIKTSEIARFVGYNASRYINVFKRMSILKSKLSWNWLSFLFPHYWLLSRKCYKIGSIATFYYLLILTLMGIATEFNQQFFTKLLTPNAEIGAITEVLNTGILITISVLLLIWFAVCVLMGFLGDYIYKRKVFRTIKILAKQKIQDEYAFYRLGGINIFLPIMAFLLNTQFVSLVVDLIK